MTVGGPLDQLRAALEDAASASTSRLIRAQPIAVGWATVDLDRAAAELADSLGIGVERFVAAPESIAMGARSLVARGALPTGESVVVLEPSTEGRLAATLARLAEGPSVAWLGVPDPAAAEAVLQAAGFAVSAVSAGPFGPERLVRDGPIHGPHRLLIQLPAGTIRA